MAKKQDKIITEKLNEVYGVSSDVELANMLDEFQAKGGKLAERREGTLTDGQARNEEGERLFTLEEFLEQVEVMQYHQPIYKGLKTILKAQGHWKDAKRGGSFGPGNPYRFTKDK